MAAAVGRGHPAFDADLDDIFFMSAVFTRNGAAAKARSAGGRWEVRACRRRKPNGKGVAGFVGKLLKKRLLTKPGSVFNF